MAVAVEQPVAISWPAGLKISVVETTVNSQLARQEWQYRVDGTGFMTAHGVPAPILIDGNDFTEMRGSVLRPGRAEFFTLEVAAEERAAIIAHMFTTDVSTIAPLLSEHKKQPLAFFRDLKVQAFDDVLELSVVAVLLRELDQLRMLRDEHSALTRRDGLRGVERVAAPCSLKTIDTIKFTSHH